MSLDFRKESGSDFITVLRNFKRVKATKLDDGPLENNSNTEIVDQNCALCENHPFISLVNGYWIECTNADCPRMLHMANLSRKMLYEFCDLGTSGNICTKIPREEIYGSYFYGSKHWNYYSREIDIGPLILTVKQEFRQTADYLRIMVRSSGNIIHGMLPAATICRGTLSSHSEVLRFISQEIGLTSPLRLITIPSAPAALLRIDKISLKDEYKIGLLYVKEGQETEEAMFENQEHSPAFDAFLESLGDRVRMRGFSKYRGGLDNANDLTGLHSVHTTYRNKQVMFHVSTLLPYDKNDSQKLQRKRHIGNDIVCVVFLEAKAIKFNPACIKSSFLHTFVVVQVDVSSNPYEYNVSVVSRRRVPLYEPRLVERHRFEKGPEFRDWILNKVINGETSCHKAPDFAKLHQRTRLQLMEELIKSVEQNDEKSQERREPQPFRDSGRRYQSARPASPYQDERQQLNDSMEDIAKYFTSLGQEKTEGDVVFLVGRNEKKRFVAVQSVMASRSSVFRKLFLEDDPARARSAETSPAVARKTSWSSMSSGASLFPGTSKTRKFVLNRVKRSQSASEADRNQVVLSAVTELEKAHEVGGVFDIREAPSMKQYVIKDYDPDVFEALLTYLHTDSIQLTPSVLPGLLCAANQYDVMGLRQLCIDSVDECLDPSTIITVLKSMEACSGRFCEQIIRERLEEFLKEGHITELDIKALSCLSPANVRLVLSHAKQVNETTKFQAVVEWAKASSLRTDCRVSIEELAKPLLSEFVNIQDISAQDLQQVVEPSGLVPVNKLSEVLASKHLST